jgi:hypothetical protein
VWAGVVSRIGTWWVLERLKRTWSGGVWAGSAVAPEKSPSPFLFGFVARGDLEHMAAVDAEGERRARQELHVAPNLAVAQVEGEAMKHLQKRDVISARSFAGGIEND